MISIERDNNKKNTALNKIKCMYTYNIEKMNGKLYVNGIFNRANEGITLVLVVFNIWIFLGASICWRIPTGTIIFKDVPL